MEQLLGEYVRNNMETTMQLQAESDFKKGLFQQIINIDDVCFESYPCQHYVTFIDNSGKEHSVLMFLPEIEKICKFRGIDFSIYKPQHRFED